MAGYTRYVIFKRAPANGPTATIDCQVGFTGARTPLFKTRVRYIPIVEDREDIERNQRPLKEGYRIRLEMDFFITTIADHATLARLKDWLSSTTGKTEVSLDGGTTYRACFLSDLKGPDPFGDKTVAGMKWVLDVDVIAPVSTIEVMTASAAGSPW